MTAAPGWSVTDADGVVLDDGPPITLTLIAGPGDDNPEGA